jgi:hypothetical protein
MNDEIINSVKNIFRISKQLTALTNRPFTPDGHMVGSIGEVYAQYYYGVELYSPSHKGHDAKWSGREVQIKATQGMSVDLKGSSDLLLVLKISPDVSFEEIYNGDGNIPWESLSHRKLTKAGEISISLKQLKELKIEAKIPRLK